MSVIHQNFYYAASPHTHASHAPYPKLKRCGVICVKTIFGVPHLLLVRGKKSKIWSLPKGCMQDGESELECAQREMMEETGVSVRIDTNVHPRIMINHNVYFLLLLHHTPKLKIRDRGEVDKVNWISLTELRDTQMDCNKDLRSIMQYPTRKFAFHALLLDALQLASST